MHPGALVRGHDLGFAVRNEVSCAHQKSLLAVQSFDAIVVKACTDLEPMGNLPREAPPARVRLHTLGDERAVIGAYVDRVGWSRRVRHPGEDVQEDGVAWGRG